MKQKVTALIVEDSPDDFFLLEDILTSSDELETVVLHESRLDNSLAAADKTAVDVAIIDLALPDSFGLNTFTAFHERYPAMPTIIMTGAMDLEMAFAAVRQGAQDYLFKGEFSPTAIVRSIRYAIERQRLMTELRRALDHVKQLQGMLPICAVCKNIRDDKGYWNGIEAYLCEHTEAVFSHSICPTCAQEHYKEFLGSTHSKL